MISTKDFYAKPADGNYTFGINKISVAAGLRKLAFQIECDQVVVQSMSISDVIDTADFASTTLSVKFNQKVTEED